MRKINHLPHNVVANCRKYRFRLVGVYDDAVRPPLQEMNQRTAEKGQTPFMGSTIMHRPYQWLSTYPNGNEDNHLTEETFHRYKKIAVIYIFKPVKVYKPDGFKVL